MEASQNLSAATNSQSKTSKSALYIGNFPEDDVRRDVLAESCEEPLCFETPDVFSVCSLYDMGIKRTSCMVHDAVTYEFLCFRTVKSNPLCLVGMCQRGKFP